MTSLVLTHEETEAQIKANDPPIEVNQRWIIYKGDEVYSRLRILAKHPDGGWIYQPEPTKFRRIELYMSFIPEYNLRRVYKLET
jgi:hypothetical protein